MRLFLAALAAMTIFAAPAVAHEFDAGNLIVDHPWATPSPPGQSQAAVYFVIQNHGEDADTLLGARTAAAALVDMHDSEVINNISRMTTEDEVIAPPGADTIFEPGGLHLMLRELDAPLGPGARFPLTLTFERAGEVEVTVVVETLADYLRSQTETDGSAAARAHAGHAASGDADSGRADTGEASPATP